MKVEFPVSVPDDDARARLAALGEYLSNRHGINVSWNGDSARFSGRYKRLVKIDGSMTLHAGQIIFEGADPGFALRGQATGYIKRKLGEYLDPSTPLDSLPRR